MLPGNLSAVDKINAERTTEVHAETIAQFSSQFQAQLCSASARSGSAARRRRYGSLKLEDMGIRSASETPVITTSDISGIILDKDGKVLSSPTAQSSIVQSIPTSCSLMQTSSSKSSSALPVNDSFGTEMPGCTSKSESAVYPFVGPSFLAGNQTSVCQKLSLLSDSCMAHVSLTSERSKIDLLPVKKDESPDSRTADLKLNAQHALHFSCPLNGHSNFSDEHLQAVHFGAVDAADRISCQATDYIAPGFSITDANIQNDVCRNCVNVSKRKGLCSTLVERGTFEDAAVDSMAAIDAMKSKKTFKKSGHLVQRTMQNVGDSSNFSYAILDSTDSKAFSGIGLNETDLIENFSSFSAASKSKSVFEKDHITCVLGNECMGEISKTAIGIEHISSLDRYFSNTDSGGISLPQLKLGKFLNVDDLSVSIDDIDEGDKFEMKEERDGIGECRWIPILDQHFNLPEAFHHKTLNDCKVDFPESSYSGLATLLFDESTSTSTPLLENTTKEMKIMCPNKPLVNLGISADSSEDRKNTGISLSSVLQKNGSKWPLSSTVKPTVSHSSLSLIPVIHHRRQSSLLNSYPGIVGLVKQSGVVGVLNSSVKHNLEDSVSSDKMQLPPSVPGTALGKDVVSASHKGDYIIVLVLYPLLCSFSPSVLSLMSDV